MERLSQTAAEEYETLENQNAEVQDCLKDLPENSKTTIKLRYYDEFSNNEIAQRLNKKVSAVEMILVRARRLLYDCLKKKPHYKEARQL